jgi:hypothetical protein
MTGKLLLFHGSNSDFRGLERDPSPKKLAVDSSCFLVSFGFFALSC